jgi:hypothetical protein
MSGQPCGVTALTKKIAVMAIPGDIREIWGDPPLLRNEDPETYEKLAGQISQAVGPIDVIEWLWVKDILDLSWEIRRLRRFKTMLIELERADSEEEYQAYHETELGQASLFLLKLDHWEKIDNLLAVAEARRAVALREIERRRASVAERLRTASNAIIEGQYEEQDEAGEISASKENDSEVP